MWTFFGLAVAIFVQNLQVFPEVALIERESSSGKVAQLQTNTVFEPTGSASKPRLQQPVLFINEVPSDDTDALQPTPMSRDSMEPATNNQSNKTIESVSPQAIMHSPALDPCIVNNCEEPTPIPTSVVHPTKTPRPTEKPVPTPFSDPAISIVPLPSQEPMPPRCPSIPPHLTKQGLERPEVADPIYCLD